MDFVELYLNPLKRFLYSVRNRPSLILSLVGNPHYTLIGGPVSLWYYTTNNQSDFKRKTWLGLFRQSNPRFEDNGLDLEASYFENVFIRIQSGIQANYDKICLLVWTSNSRKNSIPVSKHHA